MMRTGRRQLVLAGAAAGLLGGASRAQAQACPRVLDHTLPRLQDDAPVSLCPFAGRVLLVVNTASYCGYTPQYEGLEALHARYAARGFTVLGFPSNDFNQEAKDRRTIADLCFNTYGVKFPMFATTRVRGTDAHPFFAALATAAGQAPRWNFHKYLLDRQARVVASFASDVAPLDRRITDRVEQLLAAR
jgi:glutathione peroxidase